MAKERFEERRLTGSIKVACKYEDGTVRYWDTNKETVISHIVAIVNEYQREGYVLTLRQLHYQLVTQNWIVNHDTAYKKLGSILDDCRYSGVIDWDAIEDRGRVPYIPYYVNSAQEAVDDTISQFRIDRQEKQQNCVELWTEKDALSGILKRTTNKYHIRLVVNKGYTSSSAIYNAYKRVVSRLLAGQKVTILYFGDHDPSGLDMVRDIKARLIFMLTNGDLSENDKFLETIQSWWDKSYYDLYDMIRDGYAPEELRKLMGDYSDADSDRLHKMWDAGRVRWYLDENDLFNVVPIGLTMDQITQYKLPPNPTKLTDSRAAGYIKEFGRTCWEVDALKPQTLTEIVEHNIKEQIDINLFGEAKQREANELEKLKKLNL